MPKAGDVAKELRRIADSLDMHGNEETTGPMVSFYCNTKEEFLGAVRSLPRPMKKLDEDRRIILEHKTKAVWLRAVVDREKVCEIVEPAKPAVYRCYPLLSAEEEAALETA